MPLTPGTRLGPYEIVAPLAAGGMGEVYRARDSRLGREVAVKIVAGGVADTPEQRQRFEREARTVSALNHPHICVLHDVGREGDTDYLVMELIDGESLAKRLERGALPPADVLRFGGQIADALERAHRAGVVHRDLKPGNIMLTRGGVKLLDFGLARNMSRGVAGAMSGAPTMPAAPVTSEGRIVGTVQYMAPEQLEGCEADARSDLWALGATLYEMATAKRAFDGATTASVIAAVLTQEPRPLAELAPLSPPGLDRLVRACLAKDPDDRIQTAHDAKLQLQWIGAGELTPSGSVAAVGASAKKPASNRTQLAVTVVASIVAAFASVFADRAIHIGGRGPKPVGFTRFTVEPPPGTKLFGMPTYLAISPDGSTLVFSAIDTTGTFRLWRRDLGKLESVPIDGTVGAADPFFSPDGARIAFFQGGQLVKMTLAGGRPVILAPAADSRGGCWLSSGKILYAPRALGGLFVISEDGGPATEIARPDTSRGELALRFPQAIDGTHYLCTSLPRHAQKLDIWSAAIDSPKRTLLTTALTMPTYAGGHEIVQAGSDRIVGRKIARDGSRLIGNAPEVGGDLFAFGPDGAFAVVASRNGVLAYPAMKSGNTKVLELDRNGHVLRELPLPAADYNAQAVSPDGKHMLLQRISGVSMGEIWLADVATGSTTRFTYAPFMSLVPASAWSWDGKRVALSTMGDSAPKICIRNGDGSGEDDVFGAGNALFVNIASWSADGKAILYEMPNEKTGWDVMSIPTEGDHTPKPLVHTPAIEQGGYVSPDNKWVAYTSDESGRPEVYVEAYPGLGQRQQLSKTGAITATWRQDMREILVQGLDGSIRVFPIVQTSPLRFGQGRLLFQLPNNYGGYSVRGDFERHYMIVPAETPPQQKLVVDVNWRAGQAKN